MSFSSLGIVPLTTGPIFLIAGFILLKYPPKELNWVYGYRTKRSMRDKESWDFAQRYSAFRMMLYGFLLTLCSLAGFVFHPEEETGIFIGLALMLLMVVLLVVDVERALIKKFGSSSGKQQ